MSQHPVTQLLFWSDDGYTTLKLIRDGEDGNLSLHVVDRHDGETCWFDFEQETLVEFENALYAEVCRRDEGLQRVKDLTGLEIHAF